MCKGSGHSPSFPQHKHFELSVGENDAFIEPWKLANKFFLPSPKCDSEIVCSKSFNCEGLTCTILLCVLEAKWFKK